MSIKEELEKATGVKKGRNHSDQDHAKNLVDKISELVDKDWEKLSKGAQAWFNEAVDSLNDNKDAPAFVEEEKATTRRGATKEKEETKAQWIPKAGDDVIVTTKRNKVYEGEFMELDGDTAVVKVGDEEMEFTADRTLSMVPKFTHQEGGGEDVTDGSNVEVGDIVTITTKRNAVVTGTVVEITEDVVVLAVEGKEAEYDRGRVASIVVDSCDPEDSGNDDAGNDDAPPVVGDYIKAVTKRNKDVEGKVVEIEDNILIVDADGTDVEVDMDTAKSLEIVKDEKPAGRSRRGAAEPEAPTRGKREPAPATEEKKKTTKADNGGISVGLRMRQVICENPDAKVEAINKLLEKEGLSFKEATLKIVYKDVQVVFDLLKKLKHWK